MTHLNDFYGLLGIELMTLVKYMECVK